LFFWWYLPALTGCYLYYFSQHNKVVSFTFFDYRIASVAIFCGAPASLDSGIIGCFFLAFQGMLSRLTALLFYLYGENSCSECVYLMKYYAQILEIFP
jgi:hypothetical protein